MAREKYEGSKADIEKDRRMAAKRGMSHKQWEASAEDKRMDRAGQRRLDKRGKK